MQHNFQVGLARGAMPSSALALLLVIAAASQAADSDAPSVDLSSPDVQSEITRKYNRQIADGENRKLLQEIIDGAPNTTFVRNQPGYAYKHMPILEFAADAATSDVVASLRVLGADPDSSQPQDEDDYVLAVWIQRFEPTSVNETVDVNTSAAARSGWGDEQIVYLQPLAGKDSSGKGVREGQIFDGHSEARGAKGWPLRRRHRAVHAVSIVKVERPVGGTDDAAGGGRV